MRLATPLRLALCLAAFWFAASAATPAQAMSAREATALAQRAKALQKDAGRLVEAGQFAQAEDNLRQVERLDRRTGRSRLRRHP